MVLIITIKEMATVGKVRYMLVDSCMDKLKINHKERLHCVYLLTLQLQQLSHIQSMAFTRLQSSFIQYYEEDLAKCLV